MMKWAWTSWYCFLMTSAVLWGQLPSQYSGQAWDNGQVYSQGSNREVSGLIQSPNPMDSSHDWVMTGNVAGGKYFHGKVSYRASGELSIPLGTSALDGFIRYSSPVSTTHMGNSASAYYSSSRTTSHMVPGTSHTIASTVARAPSYGQSQRPSQSQSLPFWQDTTVAVELSDMKTVYPNDNTSAAAGAVLPSPQVPWETLKAVISADDALSQTSFLKSQLSNSADRQQVKSDTTTLDQSDRQETSTEGFFPWQDSPLQGGESQSTEMDLMSSTSDPMKQTADLEDSVADGPLGSSLSLASSPLSKLNPNQALSSTESLMLMSTAGDRANVPQMSNEEIVPLLMQAREHLQQGQSQAAMELYQRLARWRPRDPAVLAGQCMAHLSQGHLMSSALFLSRWLEVEPESLQQPIDIARSIGGIALLKQRLQDVEDYLAISEMEELLFLRAFLYFNARDLKQAERDINRVLVLDSSIKGVMALRDAISQ